MTTQRTDLILDSYEDLERVLEDYFRIIPADMMFIKIELATSWEYDDLQHIMTLHFDEEWRLNDFVNTLEDSPKVIDIYFDQYECVDRDALTVKLISKNKGLY